MGTPNKGIINCHAVGLNSIVLSNRPDGTVSHRVFFTVQGHTLWKNNPFRPDSQLNPMSVGFHRHERDVRLLCLEGTAWNVGFGFELGSNRGHKYHGYDFFSAIKSGEAPRFEPSGVYHGSRYKMSLLPTPPYTALQLHRDDWHTIFVPDGVCASWLVIEGGDRRRGRWDAFENIVITDDPNPASRVSSLYQPMSDDVYALHYTRFHKMLADNGIYAFPEDE